MNVDLKDLFEKVMRLLYERSISECNYPPKRFIGMIKKVGGYKTAKKILKDKYPYQKKGFMEAINAGRPDLTVEATILCPIWNELFTDEERETAIKRLSDMGYSIKKILKIRKDN